MWWQVQDRKVLKRISLLVRDVLRHGDRRRRVRADSPACPSPGSHVELSCGPRLLHVAFTYVS
ncbi:MAG: hypothetical protein H7270_03230 [Dermatophilaceae bacterium]|nr:hypothetical protein [Dermatophilaceae bacterium]